MSKLEEMHKYLYNFFRLFEKACRCDYPESSVIYSWYERCFHLINRNRLGFDPVDEKFSEELEQIKKKYSELVWRVGAFTYGDDADE